MYKRIYDSEGIMVDLDGRKLRISVFEDGHWVGEHFVELPKRKPRVHAHWINEGSHRRCSACGKRYPRSPQHKPGINLCSACGAHMDEEVAE